MPGHQYFKNRIFDIHSEEEFNHLALELFNFQARENPVYAHYLQNLGIVAADVQGVNGIPFLPIRFFKNFSVQTGKFEPEVIFSSSGTSGSISSKHHVRDSGWYEKTFLKAFERVYGFPAAYCVLALLPSYLEREGSSLIQMVERLIALSEDQDSGFYLYDHASLAHTITQKLAKGKKVILFGVTFALLDMAENYQENWESLIVIETGGMKGRRKELLREEVHSVLKSSFHVDRIHSEYGMTELLSQAYSGGDGLFECPSWMKVAVREVTDPFAKAPLGKTGGINIIDLANVDSCAFIETQDLGRVYSNGRFEVMGRFDNSDIRGCNLMVI